MVIKKLIKMAENTGVDRLIDISLLKELNSKEMEGDLVNTFLTLILVGLVATIGAVILGQLEPTLNAAIPDNSSYAGLKTSIPTTINSAYGIMIIALIILAAVAIIRTLISGFGMGGQGGL